MSKAKQWLWIVALVAALVGPTAWAEETSFSASLFDQLVAQIVALIEGSTPPSSLGDPEPPPELEIGIHVPVGG